MLRINVGFNRKVGEANYSSRGASVNLELELDSSLVGEPDRLRDRVRQMFLLAKTSVDDELSRRADHLGANDEHGSKRNATRNGNSNRREIPRKATNSQVRAIHALAERQQLDVNAVLHERYGLEDAAELSLTEASRLIDELKTNESTPLASER